MIGVALGVLGASLVGSMHCAAMCGGFSCLWSAVPDARGHSSSLRRVALPQVAYNGGRLISYAILGVLAGALGAQVTRAGALVGIAQGATIVAALLMIVWATGTIAAHCGVRMRVARAPEWWQRGMGTVLQKFRGHSAVVRGGAMGLLTTLLPCGWLYAFVATAAGTGNARDGLLVMCLFWLGTLPAMVSIGFGAQRLFGPMQRHLPVVAAVAVMLLGMFTLVNRVRTGSPSVPIAHAVQHITP